ncbi:RING-H2 finger protein ATL1 [Platanthera zijinensis]|uniref:RING-type E3 ubiquitin transferase n=1 Tax=Platanthera zijinensis TaxID=2320716 RepID=A0AAP0G795_9ASPA
MAPSPPPSPSQHHNSSASNKLNYYYFVVGLALVAIVLLVTNAIAVGCCAWLREFFAGRGLLRYDRNHEEVQGWIPSQKYRKKDHIFGEEGDGAGTPECSVCLMAFEDGEEVRQLPQCGHVFHVACIDMWLHSHSSCPVCRGSALPTPSNSMEMSARFRSHENLIPAPAAAASSSGFPPAGHQFV